MLYGTALEIALRQAGVRPASEEEPTGARMQQLAVLAWSKYQQESQYADREAFIYDVIMKDGACWLIEQWKPDQNYMQQAICWLLKKTRDEMERIKPVGARNPAPAAGPWKPRDPGPGRPAAAPSPDEDQGARGTTKPSSCLPPDPLAQSTTAAAEPRSVPSTAPPHIARLLEASTESFYMFNPFEDIIVNGRPLGKCTFDEAEAGLREQIAQAARDVADRVRHQRRCEAYLVFVKRLRANRRADDVIGYWYTDVNEVQKILAESLDECEATV